VDAVNAPERLRALPSWLLGQLSVEARREVGRSLGRFDLHRSQFAMLASLEQFGASSQAELGQRTGLDRSDVVRWVDDLAGRDLVTRDRHPTDRRRNVVTITEEGRRRLGELDDELHRAQDRLLSALAPGERKELVRLLRRALEGRPSVAGPAGPGAEQRLP
jgi:DNA-binding MarR family transcriptional regulator